MSGPLALAPTGAPIPLFDLKRQQARLRSDIDARMAHVLDHGQFVLGPEVRALEDELAAFAGVPHAIGVSSGRDALIMALMAHGIGPGDAVLVPGFTFSATAAVVVSVGAAPVFVDVHPDDFLMDAARVPEAVERAGAAGLRPRALMPVDLFGRAADSSALCAAASAHGLVLISDAAQSFGAHAPAGPVGALAPITGLSFYPTKPLGAFGDGGAILTTDDHLAEAVRAIRHHGRAGDGDEATRIGMTGRLDTLQAAVLLSKMSVFRNELERRGEVAALYRSRLDGHALLPPQDGAGHQSAWALYTVRVAQRDAVREALGAAGIGTGLFYRVPLHRHPAFADHAAGLSLPVSEAMADSVLSLPMGPDITDDEVHRVCDALIAALDALTHKKVA